MMQGMANITFFYTARIVSLDIFQTIWAAVFFVIALVAAVFGFGGIAGSAAGMAKILFIVAIVVAVASTVMGGLRRRS